MREEIFSYQHITFDVKIRLLHIKLHQAEPWKRHTVNNHREHKENLTKVHSDRMITGKIYISLHRKKLFLYANHRVELIRKIIL